MVMELVVQTVVFKRQVQVILRDWNGEPERVPHCMISCSFELINTLYQC